MLAGNIKEETGLYSKQLNKKLERSNEIPYPIPFNEIPRHQVQGATYVSYDRDRIRMTAYNRFLLRIRPRC